MLLNRIRQYLENNLRFGENARTDNRWRHLREMPFEKRLAALLLVMPDLNRVWGVDISHWDGNVDLAVTKSRGASFVFIKAVDGTIQTKYFPENRARAIAADLPHGPYGWLYRDVNVRCTAQAQAYNDIVQKYPPVMPPVIDFEWTRYAGVQSNPDYTDLRKWVTEWLRLGNPKPLLYSAAGYMNPFGAIPADLKAMFHGIWIANYGVNNPAMPYGYTVNEWVFHQFTSSGDAAALAPNDVGKKELDLNYFNGSKSDFEIRYLGGTTTPPTGGSMDKYYKVTASSLNIRSKPEAVASTDLGAFNLFKDDIIHAVESMIVAGVTFVRFDVLWRGGVKYLHPFTNAPLYVASPTGNYWSAEKGADVWMVETTEPPPPAPEPGVTIAGIRYSGEVVFDYSDGRQEVWHISDAPLTKGPVQ